MQVINVNTKDLNNGINGTTVENNGATHRKMEGGYDITGREEEFIGNGGSVSGNDVTVVQDNGAKSSVHNALLIDWLTDKCVERMGGGFKRASLGDGLSQAETIEKLAAISQVIIVRGEKYDIKPSYTAQQKMLDESGFMYVPK